MKNQLTQEWKDIEDGEVTLALKKASNWKSPGIDRVSNFWLKNLERLHGSLTTAYNDIVRNPEKSPEWLTQGLTYLLPKNNETKNPKNYRPIACLPTTYKVLTSVITERTHTFLEGNNLLPQEQKGCKRGSYGCKDQLLINKMILEDCKNKKKNLSTAWIDYSKAFDSVPHSWIIKAMEMYKLSPISIRFMTGSMINWKTTLSLCHSQGTIKTRSISIKSGIFQGDSLSPLLFCLSLAPLSTTLNNAGYGFEVGGKKISHLFYMDDLKTYVKNDNQQEGLLNTIKTFSDDICMQFGLAYKYLGINEGDGIQHATMKEQIRKEYYRRVRLVTKTELNGSNKIEAINTLAVPVFTYSVNIVNWQTCEIRKLDTTTRKLLTMERMNHPKADVERMYLPREDGGRGLTQLELVFKTTTVGLHAYLEQTEDHLPFSNLCTGMKTAISFILFQMMPGNLKESLKYQTYLEHNKKESFYLLRE